MIEFLLLWLFLSVVLGPLIGALLGETRRDVGRPRDEFQAR